MTVLMTRTEQEITLVLSMNADRSMFQVVMNDGHTRPFRTRDLDTAVNYILAGQDNVEFPDNPQPGTLLRLVA